MLVKCSVTQESGLALWWTGEVSLGIWDRLRTPTTGTRSVPFTKWMDQNPLSLNMSSSAFLLKPQQPDLSWLKVFPRGQTRAQCSKRTSLSSAVFTNLGLLAFVQLEPNWTQAKKSSFPLRFGPEKTNRRCDVSTLVRSVCDSDLLKVMERSYRAWLLEIFQGTAHSDHAKWLNADEAMPPLIPEDVS